MIDDLFSCLVPIPLNYFVVHVRRSELNSGQPPLRMNCQQVQGSIIESCKLCLLWRVFGGHSVNQSIGNPSVLPPRERIQIEFSNFGLIWASLSGWGGGWGLRLIWRGSIFNVRGGFREGIRRIMGLKTRVIMRQGARRVLACAQQF